MADSNFRGPVSNMGAMEDSPTNVAPLDGPSYSYQGNAIADVRGGAFPKDGVGAGRVAAFLDNPRIVVVDNIPSAYSTTILATAAAVDTSVAMTLTTVAPGGSAAGVPSIAPRIPIIPFGSSTVSTAALALDFGFTTGTTAAGSGSVTVSDTSVFTLGQWIIIGGAGAAAKTSSLITQVTAIGSSTITVSPVSLATLGKAPIGAANLFNQFTPPGTQFGPVSATPNAHSHSLAGGLLRLKNPLEFLARNIAIAGVDTSVAGGTFTVAGWDVWGQAMTETITVGAGTTTPGFGAKAFKYIASVTPNFKDTATYSVGIGDTFGLPIRQDRWETLELMWNATRTVTSAGFTAAVLTTPSATTGDVRGTVQLSTHGGGTPVAAPVAATTNGAIRLTIIQTVPLWNDIFSNPNNTVPFYGPTQA